MKPVLRQVNKTWRVLVVDDQAPTRQGITALLELAPDMEVTHEASDGSEAVQLVAEEQPDVVLMDVRMPVMDGLEATRQIKDRWPQVLQALRRKGGSAWNSAQPQAQLRDQGGKKWS